MNRRMAILLGAAAIVGVLLIVDGGGEDVVEAVERSAPAPVATAAPAKKAAAAEPAIARLIPRAELVGAGDDAMGEGELVFGAQNWNPPPPAPTALEAAPAPPPPSAPPLPFTYIGKANEAGTWEVYLARGDKIYIVKHQTVIDGAYRVDAIAPPTLTLTYLPLNQVQTLPIGVLE